MLTIKLKILNCSNYDLLGKFTDEYTNLFYKIYSNAELMEDPNFISDRLNDYIDKSIYDFCVSDVKIKLNQFETIKKKCLERINYITNELERGEFKSKKERRIKYRLTNELCYLKRNLEKNLTFGGKSLLREITKLSQNKDRTVEQNVLLNKKLIEFKERRNLGIYLVGRACEKGNRKVKFKLNDNEIIFKPNSKTKINISFNVRGQQLKTLFNLQKLSDEKVLPITVRLTKTHIYLTYDEEKLNGFSFNDNECKKEQKNIKDKEIRKEIFIKYKKEQELRKEKNKIKNRFISIDLNPQHIGFVIFDEVNNEQKLIHKELISFDKLSSKLKTSSHNNKQIKQNNKRKYEITQIWKYVFSLVKHYRVYNLVIEELNFKTKNRGENIEFNRKTKNIWHKTLTTNLINKYCNVIGLNKIEVNPVYSSFIGNMIYDYPDPVSSSIEIGRRGMNKYKKGSSIYPEITLINQEKLNYLLGENIDISGISWKQLYGITPLLRYRNPINHGLKDKNLYTHKSNVNRFIY